MELFLGLLCLILLIIILLLVIKLLLLRRSADELRHEFAARLSEDTNVGIDLSTNDRKMKQLAADLDRQLLLLRKAQLRYTRGDQELKKAITNISHDLRTPLTAIYGYMDLLEQEDTSETVKNYLSVIRNRIQALKDLTEELFRYSVILSVDNHTETEPVSLNSAIEECIAGYYGTLKQTGIEPVIQMPEQQVVRSLNRQALLRILSNIVSNALKYSRGDFRITLEKDGTMQFQNQAESLDEVQVSHLFDRFYTVESGRNSTGLGLSIARTLTEEMKGEIDARYQNGNLIIIIRFPKTDLPS